MMEGSGSVYLTNGTGALIFTHKHFFNEKSTVIRFIKKGGWIMNIIYLHSNKKKKH
jgi:hypothetical protein